MALSISKQKLEYAYVCASADAHREDWDVARGGRRVSLPCAVGVRDGALCSVWFSCAML